MRSLIALTSLFTVSVVASYLGATSENWRDYTWSYEPEATADYYKDHRLKPPLIAANITPVGLQKSYVVKMECLGCPFRVRKLGQTYEPWAEEPVDNSLVTALIRIWTLLSEQKYRSNNRVCIAP